MAEEARGVKAEAADAASAELMWLTELPSGDVLYVLAKDGHVDPDDEEASLQAYAQKVMERTGERRRRVVALPPRTPKTRLPREEVDLVLSIRPARFEPSDEATLRRLFPSEPVQETMAVMRDAAKASDDTTQDVISYQDWIRGELEEKGYVEVPDKFVQDRAEFIEWAQGEVDEMLSSLNIPARYFASSSDDEDDRMALES